MEQLPSDVFSQICKYLPKSSLDALKEALGESNANLAATYNNQLFWKTQLEGLLGIKHIPNSIVTNWKDRYNVFASMSSPKSIYTEQNHYEPIDMTIASLAGIVLRSSETAEGRLHPEDMTIFTLRYAVIDNNIEVVKRLLGYRTFEPIHLYDAVVTANYLGYTDIANVLMSDSRYKEAIDVPEHNVKEFERYYAFKGLM